MPAEQDVHVGDVGTVLNKTLKDGDDLVDVSTATTMQIISKHIDGKTRTVMTASFVTDGTDGQITATSDENTWTREGVWHEQVRVVLPSGEWRGCAERRHVFPAL